jgi:hypothetical protein
VHSRYFSADAHAAAAEPKELHDVPSANHVDLYDKTELIPFGEFEKFFTEHLAGASDRTMSSPAPTPDPRGGSGPGPSRPRTGRPAGGRSFCRVRQTAVLNEPSSGTDAHRRCTSAGPDIT